MINLSSPAAVGAILRRLNLRPQRKLGQNFLVDANILTKIAAASELLPGESALEIGPGLGVLTQRLAEQVGVNGRVAAIEIDRNLLPALEESVGELSQVSVITADALVVDFDELVLSGGLPLPLRVVANIPYQITSPLIVRLLEMKQQPATIVLLVQKEVAQRLASLPGSTEYGALTVYVNFHAKIEIAGTVSRTCFFPPPEVTSSIIKLTPYGVAPVDVRDKDLLFSVVRAAFGQRRKTLLNALANDADLGWSKPKAAQMLAAAGVDGERRGETLSLAEFAAVANAADLPS